MKKSFPIAFAAILALGAWFADVNFAVAQDGASDDLKINEIFGPAWDSKLLPDLPDKALRRAPLDGDICFPQADGESPCELKEERLSVSEGETSDISAKRVKEPEDANNQTRPNFSEHGSDGGEAVLKGVEQTNALSRFLAFGSVDGDSEFASAASRVGSSLETLSNALATIGAQDELNALEQVVRNWLETELDRQCPRRELTNVYKNVLLIMETNRALNSPEASELGKARVLRKLLDAELATETPDETRVLFFREKYYGEITRDFQENPSKRDEILLTALREEKASPRPQSITRYFLLPNWGAEARRLLVEKGDFDGALELALACVDCSFDDASHNVLKEVENAFAALMSIDSNKGDEKIVEAMERYLASDDQTLVQAGLRLGYLRKCEGAKPNLEGVCVDGSVFDWSAYRGKSTILVLCDSNSFLSPSFKASYELLRRFAENDSASILTYAADDDLERWKPFENATPWQTISKTLTLAAQDNKYREFTRWNGFYVVSSGFEPIDRRIPRFILFDSEGVVVKNLDCNYAALETLLSEIYPNYFETAYRSVVELFDVPDDQNLAFYEQRLQELGKAETTIFNSLNSHREPNYEQALKQMEQKRADAVERTLKLAIFRPEDDHSIDDAKKNALINEYAYRIVNREDRAAAVELLNFENAKANPNMGLVSNLRNRLAQWDLRDAKADPDRAVENLRKLRDAARGQKTAELPPGLKEVASDQQWDHSITYEILDAEIQEAARASDEQGAKEALDRCLADVADVPPSLPGTVWLNLDMAQKSLKKLDRPDLAEYFRKAGIEKFKTSDNPFAEYFVSDLQAIDRYNDLPGNELDFQAHWFNPDDFKDNQRVDWASFRGKVVLICYVTPLDSNTLNLCAPETSAKIDELKALWQKYGDAGLEVVLYFREGAPEQCARLIKEMEVPWRTTRTYSVRIPSFYKTFREYYDLKPLTTILVGKDGKVVDNNASGERLEKELEELFPARNPVLQRGVETTPSATRRVLRERRRQLLNPRRWFWR